MKIKNWNTSLFLMIAFTNSLNAQRYGIINDKLDKMLAERNNIKELINVDLVGKKFITMKPEVSIKKIIQFEENNKITIIEIIDDIKKMTHASKIYTGDAIKNNNKISVRADKLEGKTISLPYTFNFILQKIQDRLYLLDVNSNERWIDAKL